MKIVIAGFHDNDYELLSRVMNDWIERNQCYLFYIVCGGTDKSSHRPNVSEQWARNNGAPIQYIWAMEQNVLIEQIVRSADFLIARRDDSSFVRNLIMGFRASGKHGMVI